MMDMLTQAALALSVFPLSILAKATLVLAVALIAVQWRRRTAPATVRHLVLALAFGVLMVLPAAELAGLSITIPVDRSQTGALPELPITLIEMDQRVVTPSSSSSVSPAPPPGSAWPSRATLLFAVWAIGAVVCLIPVLRTPTRVRQLRDRSRSWSLGNAILGALEMDPRRRRRTEVLVHDDVTAPLTCGVARPAILMPAEAAGWSDAEIRQALVHEMEHVRRADWPVHVATRVVCALYWFHPLVWIAWRRLGIEAERACDDAVLRTVEQTAYAQQLVTLARRNARPSPIPALSMAGRSDLSERVAAVLDDAQARGHLGFTRMAAIVGIAGLLVVIVAPLRAQDTKIVAGRAGEAPAFEVASIKENKSGDPGSRQQRLPGGRIVFTNVPLRDLILLSYALQPSQLVGQPDWITSARFDITAQAGEIPATRPGVVGPAQLMMQHLLADRFNLAVHTETREMSIYALTLARRDGKLGPRIAPAVTDCESVMAARLKAPPNPAEPQPPSPQLPNGAPACGMRFHWEGRIMAGGISMTQLAQNLSPRVGRPIVDRTGLSGGFDFELEFVVDPGMLPDGAAPPPPDPDKPSIFTALEEQLGLKLQADRAGVEVLVIDRVTRPTEN
jgi:uncharacterized protein (TIGR03435 family)